MISIIVSVYNSERYLHQCMESILAQTYEDFELLLINDGSTDGSSTVCWEFEKRDRRIKVFDKQNGGLSSARNVGISEAHGEYVLFLDSDDWFEPDMLMELANAAQAGKYDVVTQGFQVDYIHENYTLYESISQNSDTERYSVPEIVELLENSGLFNSACNKLYKKAMITDNGISFRTGMEPGEDLLFNCTVFRYVTSCSCLKYCGYHYVKRGEVSLTSKYYHNYEEKIFEYYRAREELYNIIMLRNGKKYLDNSMTSYTISAISNIYNKNSGNSFRMRTHLIRELFGNNAVRHAVNNSTFVNIYVVLMRVLIKMHSPVIANSVYSVLFWFRRHFITVYNYFRKKALYGQ